MSPSYLSTDATACLEACPDDGSQFLNATLGACVAVSSCGGGEYEAAAPTPTTDRACAPITACDEDAEFEVAAPTATQDRVCQALLPCDEGTVRDSTNVAVCRQCPQGFVERSGACELLDPGPQQRRGVAAPERAQLHHRPLHLSICPSVET